jgi:cytochrome o ubiquinol oxidase operon protein cyoD
LDLYFHFCIPSRSPMNHELSLQQIKKEWHGTLKGYLTGFVICILLTSISFLLAITKPFDDHYVILTIFGLALIQASFQLRHFLHLGQEGKPRWESIIFYFVMLILVIVVAGTLWIMHDLNERVMMVMHHD